MKTASNNHQKSNNFKVLKSVLIKLSVFLLIAQIKPLNGQAMLGNDSETFRFMVSNQYDSSEAYGYTLFDNVILRIGSHPDAERMGMVSIDTKLILLEESENVTELNGVKSPWYRCEIADQDQKNEIASSSYLDTWVWGGNLAIVRSQSENDEKTVFLSGVQSRIKKKASMEPYNYYISKGIVQVVKNHKVIDQRNFRGETDFPVARIENLGNKGLKGVDDVIVVSNLCEFCGCPGVDHYYFWNGKVLQPVTNATYTPDGDFSFGTYLVFPIDEGGEKDVVKVMYEDYKGDGSQEDNTNLPILYETNFSWDGNYMQPKGAKKRVDVLAER